MKNFYELLVLMENESLNIPSLPSNMVRLTHFTHYTKEILDNGLKVAQDLDRTTDSHYNNADVLQTIKSGMAGSMLRSNFGPYVILLDLPDSHYKILRGTHNFGGGEFVPRTQILGYVDRKDMTFHKSPHYNPMKMSLPKMNDKHDIPGMGTSSGGEEDDYERSSYTATPSSPTSDSDMVF